MATDRREFIRTATLGAAVVSGVTRPGALDSGQGSASPQGQGSRAQLDSRLLAALGEAVLPEALGASGRRAVVLAFEDWLAGYRPASEEMHGYGYAEITFTTSDPAPGWNAQLAALDLLAVRMHEQSFDALDLARRRDVVASATSRVSGSRLPANPLAATHVAVALLAHWASSSEAVDLAYGASIGRATCRPLAETVRRPLPIAPGQGR